MVDDVLAHDFNRNNNPANDYEDDFYVNDLEKRLQQERMLKNNLRATKEQQKVIGDRLTNQKTIVQQIREFQT